MTNAGGSCPISLSLARQMDAIGFVCGCGHTGTSLIANILAAHPDIYVPLRETGAFRGGATKARQKVAALLREAIASGRSVLVEKTPRHILHLDRIRAWTSGAKLIMPVRDGRDVVASITERTGDPRKGEARWISETAIVAAQMGEGDSLVLRYEDLVEDPEAAVGRICTFLGVEFRRALMSYHTTPRLWFGETTMRPEASPVGEEHQKARRNWQINQPIVDRRGRWRGVVAENDFAGLLVGEGRHLMELFGYV